MMDRKERGAQGEQLVACYLEKEGFTIHCTNYSSRVGEIDIIAQRNDVVAFVEVKLRQTAYFNTSQVIVPAKQRKIIATAQRYIVQKKLSEAVHRFDVALLEWNGYEHVITYIPNAFTAPESL